MSQNQIGKLALWMKNNKGELSYWRLFREKQFRQMMDISTGFTGISDTSIAVADDLPRWVLGNMGMHISRPFFPWQDGQMFR